MSEAEGGVPTPLQLAESLLARRIMLRDALPGVIRTLQAEEEAILPKLRRSVESNEKSNKEVARLKRSGMSCGIRHVRSLQGSSSFERR